MIGFPIWEYWVTFVSQPCGIFWREFLPALCNMIMGTRDWYLWPVRAQCACSRCSLIFSKMKHPLAERTRFATQSPHLTTDNWRLATGDWRLVSPTARHGYV